MFAQAKRDGHRPWRAAGKGDTPAGRARHVPEVKPGAKPAAAPDVDRQQAGHAAEEQADIERRSGDRPPRDGLRRPTRPRPRSAEEEVEERIDGMGRDHRHERSRRPRALPSTNWVWPRTMRSSRCSTSPARGCSGASGARRRCAPACAPRSPARSSTVAIAEEDRRRGGCEHGNDRCRRREWVRGHRRRHVRGCARRGRQRRRAADERSRSGSLTSGARTGRSG